MLGTENLASHVPKCGLCENLKQRTNQYHAGASFCLYKIPGAIHRGSGGEHHHFLHVATWDTHTGTQALATLCTAWHQPWTPKSKSVTRPHWHLWSPAPATHHILFATVWHSPRSERRKGQTAKESRPLSKLSSPRHPRMSTTRRGRNASLLADMKVPHIDEERIQQTRGHIWCRTGRERGWYEYDWNLCSDVCVIRPPTWL